MPYIWVWRCPRCNLWVPDTPPDYYRRKGKTTCRNPKAHPGEAVQMIREKRSLSP